MVELSIISAIIPALPSFPNKIYKLIINEKNQSPLIMCIQSHLVKFKTVL